MKFENKIKMGKNRYEIREEEVLGLRGEANMKMEEIYETFLDGFESKDELFETENDNSGLLKLSLEKLKEINVFERLEEIRKQTLTRIENGAVKRLLTESFTQTILSELLVDELLNENSHLGKTFAEVLRNDPEAESIFYRVENEGSDSFEEWTRDFILRNLIDSSDFKNYIEIEDKKAVEKILEDQFQSFLENNKMFVKIYFLTEDRKIGVFAIEDYPIEYLENLKDKNNVRPQYLFSLKEHSSPFTIKKGDRYIICEEGGSELRRVLEIKKTVYKKTGVELISEKDMELKVYQTVRYLSKNNDKNIMRKDFISAGYTPNKFNRDRLTLNARQEIDLMLKESEENSVSVNQKPKI